jgi:uncharacterized protein (DUF4415 family)
LNASSWTTEAADHGRGLAADTEVVERFKAGGPGWQTRMDKALKKAAGL